MIKTLITLNAVICTLVCGTMVGIGLNLKKWYSWALGLYAFTSFFLVGLIGTGNINESIKIGALVSCFAIFGGAVMRWNRERSEKWLEGQNKKE